MLKKQLDSSLAEVLKRKKVRARLEEVESSLSGTITAMTDKLYRLREENDQLESVNAQYAEETAILGVENERLEQQVRQKNQSLRA